MANLGRVFQKSNKLKNPFWLQSYHARFHNTQIFSVVPSAGKCYVSPFYVEKPMTFSRINLAIQTAGGAGTFYRVGIFANNSLTLPTPDGGLLIFDSGDIDATITGNKSISLPSKIRITDRFVWLVLQTGDATIRFYSLANNAVPMTAFSTEKLRGCNFIQAYGAFPNTCPATTLDDNARLDAYLMVDSIE